MLLNVLLIAVFEQNEPKKKQEEICSYLPPFWYLVCHFQLFAMLILNF